MIDKSQQQTGEAQVATTKTPEDLTQRVETFAKEIGEDVHVAWSAFEAWVRRELDGDKAQKAEIAAKAQSPGEAASLTAEQEETASAQSQKAAAGTDEAEPVNTAGVQAESNVGNVDTAANTTSQPASGTTEPDDTSAQSAEATNKTAG